jgi:hypothetical protein
MKQGVWFGQDSEPV